MAIASPSPLPRQKYRRSGIVNEGVNRSKEYVVERAGCNLISSHRTGGNVARGGFLSSHLACAQPQHVCTLFLHFPQVQLPCAHVQDPPQSQLEFPQPDMMNKYIGIRDLKKGVWWFVVCIL
jgi:hypothetical protein